MSLTSTIRPAATKSSFSMRPRDDVPFHLQPTYLTLHRMLIRYQRHILLQPPNDNLSTFQVELQRGLRSPLPYQRTKWLHNIEYARTLLLQLEHSAQGIKVQRAKRDAVRDLAEKRATIKKLRIRVVELGDPAEVLTDEQWAADGKSETLEEMLGRPLLQEENASRHRPSDLEGATLVMNTEEESTPPPKTAAIILDGKPYTTRSQKDELLGPRRRKGNTTVPQDTGTTSGFSDLETTERVLLNDSRTQEDLTTSLVSMAAQLKQQARSFQGALELDKGLLDRALEGLDKNVEHLAVASRNMQFLRRMSEGQGWWGG